LPKRLHLHFGFLANLTPVPPPDELDAGLLDDVMAETPHSAEKKSSMTIQGYDLVGDIHGHADALHRLLHELDYAVQWS
jgi:hypothetical protein